MIWDAKQPEPDAMQYLLVYFRRSFRVPEGITAKLNVEISADSRYRLYVNGRSVSVGPCKGDAQTQYYETVDVSSYLQSGENVLAVKVMRLPSHEPVTTGEAGSLSIWRSQSAGLFVEASMRDDSGTELEPLHSGSEWRTFRHKGYHINRKSLMQWIGGVEEVNGGGAPPQLWANPGFEDTGWTRAIPFAETRGEFGLLSPWNLVPRPVPFLYEEDRDFIKVVKADGVELEKAAKLMKGQRLHVVAGQKVVLELDAGERTTGNVEIALSGGQGRMIRFMGSECYEKEFGVMQAAS